MVGIRWLHGLGTLFKSDSSYLRQAYSFSASGREFGLWFSGDGVMVNE